MWSTSCPEKNHLETSVSSCVNPTGPTNVSNRKEYSLPFPDAPPYCAWLGNLSSYTTEQDMMEYFNRFQIVPSDIRFGRRKGPHTCAYIDFSSSNDLLKSLQFIDAPNSITLRGRKVEIDIADGILHSRIRAIGMAHVAITPKEGTSTDPSVSNEIHSPLSSSVLSLSTFSSNSSSTTVSSNSSTLASSPFSLGEKSFNYPKDKKRDLGNNKRIQRNFDSNWRNTNNAFTYKNNLICSNIDNNNKSALKNKICIENSYDKIPKESKNIAVEKIENNKNNNAKAKRYLYDVNMIKHPLQYKAFPPCIMISRPYSYYYFYYINNYLQLLYYPQQPLEMNKNILHFNLFPIYVDGQCDDNNDFPYMRIQVYHNNMKENDNVKFLTWCNNGIVGIKTYEETNQQLWKLIKYNNHCGVDWYKIVSLYNNNFELYVDQYFILSLRKSNENSDINEKNQFFQFLSQIV